MHSSGELLKTDALGRVRTPAVRREALLSEFERSGTSARKFAELAGINYQTFATWVQKRRREGGPSAGAVRLVEAVVDGGGDGAQSAAASTEALVVHLPAGVRVEICHEGQAALVVSLVMALEARHRSGPC